MISPLMVQESDIWCPFGIDHCQGSQGIGGTIMQQESSLRSNKQVYHLNCGSQIIFDVPRTMQRTKNTRRMLIRTFLLPSYHNLS